MVYIRTYELFDFLKRKKPPVQFTPEEIGLLQQFSTYKKYSTFGVDVVVDVYESNPNLMLGGVGIKEPISLSDKINRKLYKELSFCQKVKIGIWRHGFQIYFQIKRMDSGFLLDMDWNDCGNMNGDIKNLKTIEEVCDNINIVITQSKLYLCFQNYFFSSHYEQLKFSDARKNMNVDQYILYKDFQNLLNDFSVVNKNNKVSKFRLESLLEEMLNGEYRLNSPETGHFTLSGQWRRGRSSIDPDIDLKNNLQILLSRIELMHIDVTD